MVLLKPPRETPTSDSAVPTDGAAPQQPPPCPQTSLPLAQVCAPTPTLPGKSQARTPQILAQPPATQTHIPSSVGARRPLTTRAQQDYIGEQQRGKSTCPQFPQGSEHPQKVSSTPHRVDPPPRVPFREVRVPALCSSPSLLLLGLAASSSAEFFQAAAELLGSLTRRASGVQELP